jgi:hypothetical protein
MIHKVNGGIFVICYQYRDGDKLRGAWLDIEVSQPDDWENVKKYVSDSIEREIGTDTFLVTSFTRIQ